MVFERLDGTLCCIAAVVVGWDKLVVNTFLSKVAFEGGGGFVVKALVLGRETTVHKILVDGVECSKVFSLSSTFHWCSENGIAIIDVANQDIFVSMAGGDWETASEVRGNFMVGLCNG